jgi:hypothetical protein
VVETGLIGGFLGEIKSVAAACGRALFPVPALLLLRFHHFLKLAADPLRVNASLEHVLQPQ